MKIRMLLALLCMLILSIGYYMQQQNLSRTWNTPIQQQITVTPIISNDNKSTEKKVPQNIASLPVKLEFERTQITVNILPVELDPTGRMNVRDGLENVSWYKKSAIPGNQGNAIIAGHRDWKGELGPFQSLEDIQMKEKIIIQYKNQEIRRFQVAEKQVYSVNDVPVSVMNVQMGTRVTLITCTGKFIREKGGYQSRIIVTLQLI